MANDKVLQGLDTAINVLGSGSGLLGAPGRALKVAKNVGKGLVGGLTKHRNGLSQQAQRFAKQNEKMQKQKERADLKKQMEVAKQQKAFNKLQANVDKNVAKSKTFAPTDKFEMPKPFDIESIMNSPKVQEMVQKRKEKEQQALIKTNQNRFRKVAKDMKGNPNKAMKQLFPYSNRQKPVGIIPMEVPQPGQKAKLNVNYPSGANKNISVRLPKKRLTKQQKVNKQIGQGLSNPISYDDKIKKIMGLE